MNDKLINIVENLLLCDLGRPNKMPDRTALCYNCNNYDYTIEFIDGHCHLHVWDKYVMNSFILDLSAELYHKLYANYLHAYDIALNTFINDLNIVKEQSEYDKLLDND